MNIDYRSLLLDMFKAAVDSARPARCLPRFLPLPPKGRTIVVGAGKAAAAMAAAVEAHWNGPFDGLVITRDAHGAPCRSIEVIEASHPVPDSRGQEAARRIFQKVSNLRSDDLVLILMSGGASSLLALPAAGIDLDVSSDEQIDESVRELSEVWDRLDVLVHSIGYAPRGALDGRFTDVTTREVWKITMDVSAYSLIGLSRAFRGMMPADSSIVSLSYYGAEKVVTNYNVMGVAKAALEASTRYLAHDLGQDGIRVNAISAGPVKTLAAAGIKGMRTMLGENADKTPLRRNIDQDDVAKAALYLCSDLGRSVTGEVLHVDCGQNIMGVVGM